MKRTVAAVLMGILVLSLTACGGTKESEKSNETDENTQIPNPFIETTKDEAEKLSGISFSVPEKVEGYDNCSFMAIENELIQAYYTNGAQADGQSENGADEQDNLLIRKAAGSEDISGDYNDYEQISFVKAGELDVTMKGNNDLVYVAIWNKDGYTFAVDTTNPITLDQMKEIIENVQ